MTTRLCLEKALLSQGLGAVSYLSALESGTFSEQVRTEKGCPNSSHVRAIHAKNKRLTKRNG